jgi:hypothetical protein
MWFALKTAQGKGE